MTPGEAIPTQIIEPHELPELLRQAATYMSTLQDEIYERRGTIAAQQRDNSALETRVSHLERELAEKEERCKRVEASEALFKAEVDRLQQQCQQLQATNNIHDVKRDMQALESRILQFQQQHAAVIAQAKKRDEEHQRQMTVLKSQLERESARYKDLEQQVQTEKKRADDAVEELGNVKQALRKTRAVCEAMQASFKRTRKESCPDFNVDAATEADTKEVLSKVNNGDPSLRSIKQKTTTTTKDLSALNNHPNSTVDVVVPAPQPQASNEKTSNAVCPPPQQRVTVTAVPSSNNTAQTKDTPREDLDSVLVTQPVRHHPSRSSKVVAETEQQQQQLMDSISEGPPESAHQTDTASDIVLPETAHNNAQPQKQQRQHVKELRDPPPQRQLGKRAAEDALEGPTQPHRALQSNVQGGVLEFPQPRGKGKMRSPAWKQANRNDDELNRDADDDFGFSPGALTKQQHRPTTTINEQQQQEQQFETPPDAMNDIEFDVVDAAGAVVKDVGPGYKYQEVVRKKDEREKLQAFECEECKRFYAAMQAWGDRSIQHVPKCGHVAEKQATVKEMANKDELRQNIGRHRYRYQPPATPKGFWHVGFSPDK